MCSTCFTLSLPYSFYNIPFANTNSNCLKNIQLFVDDKPVKALVDCGAQRSCINSKLDIIKPSVLIDNPARLVCANGEKLECSKQGQFNLRIGNLNYKSDLIVVDNLSTDLILGLDIIKTLSFEENSDFVIINKEKIHKLLIQIAR